MIYDNIKLKQLNDNGAGNTVPTEKIDAFLAPLIDALALKYPQWEFRETHNNYVWDNIGGISNKCNFTATTFTVFEKREELGTLYINQDYRGEKKFAVDNFRIDKLRQRGSGLKTIHLKKAIKHVDKLFGARNVIEKMHEAIESASRRAYRVKEDLNNQVHHSWNRFNATARSFLVAKYLEEFKDFCSNNPDTASFINTLDELPDRVAKASAGQEVHDALQTGSAYVVYIDGMNYSLHLDKQPLQIKKSEELPEFMRRGIGMLKLVEDGQVIGGIGLRVDKDTYVVLSKI